MSKKPNLESEIGILKPVKLVTLTAAQLQARENAILEEGERRMDTIIAFHELNHLIQRIDLIATLAPIKDRADKLDGCSTELAAAYEKLIGAGRLIGLDVANTYPDSNRRVSQRIAALQIVSIDQGKQLLEVIGDMPGEFGSLATAATEKVRQGPKPLKTTQRLFELVEKYHSRYRWKETIPEIFRELEQGAAKGDKTDSDLLNTLRYTQASGEKALIAYIQETCKNYRKSKVHYRDTRKN